MKKAFMSVLALIVLAGCAGYDYYEGDVRYVQDGEDCVFYTEESGRYFSDEIRSLDADKKVVYRNTRCETLFNRDMMGQAPRHDRKIIVPAAKPCGCAAGAKYVKVN